MLEFQTLFLKAHGWITKQSRILKIQYIHVKSQFSAKLGLIVLITGRFQLENGLKRHVVNGKAYWNFTEFKILTLLQIIWLCLKVLQNEGSSVSTFLLIGWFLLVQFPLNPTYSSLLLYFQNIVITLRRRASDLRLKASSLLSVS